MEDFSEQQQPHFLQLRSDKGPEGSAKDGAEADWLKSDVGEVHHEYVASCRDLR
jgi:hypothetical protein